MSNINYLEIFKKAYKIAWNHKKLWWFGLIVGSGSGINLNLPFRSQEKMGDEKWVEQITSFFSEHFSLIAGIAIFLLCLGIAWGILKILAYSGLIREVIATENGKDYDFWQGISEGKKFFWRILKIKIIFVFFSLALILVLALPVVFLLSLHSYVLGVITGISAVIILIPALIIFSFIETFGNFYVITSDLSLKMALEQGYKIFIKNVWPSIIMSLLFIPFNIILGIAVLVSLLLAALVFFVIGFVFYQLHFLIGLWIVGILGTLILSIALLIIRAALGTFYNTAWFLFFKEIAAVKKEEVKISEELLIAEGIQPEKV